MSLLPRGVIITAAAGTLCFSAVVNVDAADVVVVPR
jgi:hypothetical protein